MITRTVILSAILQSTIGHFLPAQSGINDIQVLKGSCDATSHTAEGPLNSDLTKRESKFYCDSAIISFFSDSESHIMIQFSQKESRHSPILGFSGRVDAAGITMQVDNVYLTPGEPTTVSEGVCQLYFKNRHMVNIMCGMKVDETGRRTVAVVLFNAAPGQ